MAGTMRKMAEYLGLVESDLDDYEAEPVETRARPAREHYTVPAADVREVRPRPLPETTIRPVATAVAERPAPAATLKPTGSTGGADVYRIETLHPRSYNDARRIGEEYREGVPVIVNLTGMDDSDAKRIVDFAAGLIFGLRGSIERITNKVFLLSPANVDVGAEARAQIAQDGFFNQS